jgi:inhibitor of KinA
VCYEEPYALDLQEVSKFSGLTPKEIIELHTGETYRVYMLGFLPGFPYLGVLPKALQLPRKRTPRVNVPERSVGIAGQQTGIYPSGSPGGWNILGNTPLPIFNSSSDSPFLLQVGDKVKFKVVSSREYQKLHQQIQHQVFNWEAIYG